MKPPPTWHVPDELRDAWESLPARRLAIGSGDETGAYLFPEPTPADLETLLSTLDRAGERLAGRPLGEITRAISAAASRFGDPASALRQETIELLAHATGRAEGMIAESMDILMAKLSPAGLRETVCAAVGEPAALDGFVAATAGRTRRAVGPRITYHMLAGNTPWAGVESLVAALLARSASLVKMSSGEPVLAGLFARSLAEIDSEIGTACAVLHWPGGDERLETVALTRANAVVAFGDNESVAVLSQKLSLRVAAGTVRFIARGHRASVALVGAEALVNDTSARETAAALAQDFSLEDQEGCLSPHAAYLETQSPGDGPAAVSAERFADFLAEALEECERRWPRRALDRAEASRIQQERGAAELRGATVLSPERSTKWTVVVDPRIDFAAVPLHRYATLRPVEKIHTAIRALEPACGMLSTIAVSGFGERRDRIVDWLAALCPGRICPLGQMQRPPAGWNHDGQSDLAALLTWVESEESG
jgi:hypothetical protein